MITSKINHILNLMERITEKQCELDITLDGTITITITNLKSEGVQVPDNEELKSLPDDGELYELDKFLQSLPERV